MKRREIIKNLSLLPLVSGIVASPFAVFADTAKYEVDNPKSLGLADENVYKSIGVETFVNCKGTNTIMGGSLTRPEVKAAMESASMFNVQLDELAFGVGQKLSELTGAEWGMISAGCAAGLKLATIACLTGGDPEKLIRLPNLTGFEKNEVIIPTSSRNVYDHAVRSTGITVVMVDTLEELQNSINHRTAMIYMLAGSKEPLSLENVSKIARRFNVPVLADAAANVLTFPDKVLAKGASVVAYSGGKCIKGPACAGLILGNKNIILAAWQASAPHHGFGRDNKLGKEEHIGMLAAVEAWIKTDHAAEMKTWVSWLENISKRVSRIKDVTTQIVEPSPSKMDHVTPILTISWDPDKLNITGEELADELGHTTPRIAVNAGKTEGHTTSIVLVGYIMVPGSDKIAGERIYEVLSRKRIPKVKAAMKAPAYDISGRWDVTVQFSNSKSEQSFFIEKQEGNWLQGVHKSSFSERELTGTIEGDQIKLKSLYSVPGDRILSIFFGSVSGNNMKGDLDMGEYITASFTAKKHIYHLEKEKVIIPDGRVQAS
jgi:seryl-tRNA(Sec) selenium transferase